MHDRRSDRPEAAREAFVHPLKELSAREFAALGGSDVVFVRSISAGELARFVPEAAMAPEEFQFQMIMSAEGAPLMVSDNVQAVHDWLGEHPVSIALRH